VNELESAALLLYTEEAGPVGGVRGLVDTCSELVFEDLDDVVEDPIGDQDVLVDPRDMLDGWDLDWGEVVVMEPTLLFLSPCEAKFIDLKDVLQ